MTLYVARTTYNLIDTSHERDQPIERYFWQTVHYITKIATFST